MRFLILILILTVNVTSVYGFFSTESCLDQCGEVYWPKMDDCDSITDDSMKQEWIELKNKEQEGWEGHRRRCVLKDKAKKWLEEDT